MPVRNISSERTRIGMSQEALASYLEVSSRRLADWEVDPKKAPGSILNKMADLFGCTTDYLLGRVSERLPPKSA